MELIERDNFLELLQAKFETIATGEGHCIFVSGEAGIGKTALVKAFCKQQQQSDCNIYQGACDALFTPRPLAPLYDIMWQVNSGLWPGNHTIEKRSELFAPFFRELIKQKEKSIIVFEDIHWADEATLDFIKFFARRISQLRCLFILTYREDEIHSSHALKNVLGQLPPDSFSRLKLTPLSKSVVEKMALEKGYNGEDVYSISGGNPFYVNEILASYSTGVPDNIKDSILSVYNRQDEKTKHVWGILSILPAGFNIKYLEKIKPSYAEYVQQSLDTKILVLKEGILFFKHELYRRTIEASLSPIIRMGYNKTMLSIFMESYENNREIERIVHLAKNANEYDTVIQYAPLAAKQAASVGAHIEASKLYLTAIEYYKGNDKTVLIQFYEAYAYECYLTNQIKEAIIYQAKALTIWKEQGNKEKTGNAMRFLSRLWWFDGKRKQAENFGEKAVEILKEQPASKTKAMAYSNMSQLKLLSDQSDECILLGEKAIKIAKEINDGETLAHALNNMGSALMLIKTSMQQGILLLQQSLQIALENSYHEHAARAYAALGSNAVAMKEYVYAGKALEDGITYCEERDLDSLKLYMISWKARLNLETGFWKEAYADAENLLRNENLLPVIKIGALLVSATINFRRGDKDALSLLLQAKAYALETNELQRIIPALYALLEYEWITDGIYIEKNILDETINVFAETKKVSKKSLFFFWLKKARKQYPLYKEIYKGYEEDTATKHLEGAALWKKLGCPYEHALCLFEGNDNDKRKALTIVHELGANAVYEKMKLEMRTSGIKNIPRGIRKTTLANHAFLTGRELDVLPLLKEGLQNKEIAARLFISAKTVDHHISSILFKLGVNSRIKAVSEAVRKEIIN